MKMKYMIPALVALMASCSTETKDSDVASTAEESSAVEEGKVFHSSQLTSLKYVDLDGEFLSLNNVDGEVELVKVLADLGEKVARADENISSQLPASVHFRDLLAKTKLDALKNVAASSKKVDGGWINKVFYDVNGSQGGVFSFFKGKGGNWSAYDFAPAEADMVLEFDVNLENVRGSLEYMMSEFPKQQRDQLLSLFDQGSQSDEVMKMVVDGVHARISLVTQLDRQHTLTPEDGVKLYNANVVARIEGLTKFWKKFSTPVVANFELEEKDGLKYYRAPKVDVPKPLGNVPAVSLTIVVDEVKDQIWVTSREDFLNECLSGGKKLKDSAEVVELMKDLSNSGNSFSFVSHDMLSYCQELYQSEGMKRIQLKAIDETKEGSEREIARLGFKMLDSKVIPALVASKQGFAMTVDLNDDGVLLSSKTPVAMKGSSSSTSLLSIPALASVASPIIIKQIAKSRATQAISNSKDIYVGLRDYNFKNGKLPDSEAVERSSNHYFRKFFEERAIIDEKPFFVKGVEGAIEGDGNISKGEILERGSNVFGYFPGANIVTDVADRPLLISPLVKKNGKAVIDTKSFGGQVVILYTDGSCMVYPVVSEDDSIWNDQGDLIFKNGHGYFKNLKGETEKVKVALPEM